MKYFEGNVYGTLLLLKRHVNGKTGGYEKCLVKCIACDYEFEKWMTAVREGKGCKNCIKTKDNLQLLRAYYRKYKSDAKKRQLVFDISLEEFLEIVRQECFYCGLAPILKQHKKFDWYFAYMNGVDRKDNSVGYTLTNCVPCCKICNRAKSNLEIEEFRNYMNRIVNNGVRF